ncbi:hypothetical protein OUZ56_012637 [Daphnia magna]|uniref:Chromo domain-containing protein n=1 Tax=Daphnia magna TaxID=35525 RepID=A0ABQ9Z3L3_9CRUS|nr:hypothetical protein OUZ56_012637 [Daphnia magna]
MPRNHQVQDFKVEFEEFEEEAVLDRRVMLLDNNRKKIQYLLKYVSYDNPEWTNWGNCTNCTSIIKQFLRDKRATAVNEARPDVVSESEVEPDGDALLYCEALKSSEGLHSDDADPAESTGSPTEESGPSAESAGPPAEESGPSDWAWVDF